MSRLILTNPGISGLFEVALDLHLLALARDCRRALQSRHAFRAWMARELD
jgi:hypothetical protein